MPYDITVLEGFDAVDRLADDWASLFARIERPNLPHHFAFFRACVRRWRHVPGAELVVLVLRDRAGQPVLVAPFAREREFGLLKRLTLLHGKAPYGSDVLVDPALADDEALWSTLWQAVRTRLGARRLRIDWLSMNQPLGTSVLAQRHTVSARSMAFRIDLTPYSDKDYLQAQSADRRQDHRRMMRRLADLGPLDIRRREPHDLTRGLDWLFTAKQDWARRKGLNTEWFWNPLTRVFIDELVSDFAQTGAVWIDEMRVGERIVASHLGFAMGPTMLSFMSTYDPAFGKYSPGLVLSTVLIERAIADGFAVFDMMNGDLPWKRRLADQMIDVQHLRVPLRWYG